MKPQVDIKAPLSFRIRGLSPSATVAINDRSNELRQQGVDVFKLGMGQSPFPVPEPVVAELRRHAARKDYLSVKGLMELRETVADHHRRTFGIECTAEDVLIGPGSKILMFLLQICYDGEIIIPTPSWVSYKPQARIIGRPVLTLPTSIEDRWLPTAQQLEKLCWCSRDTSRILVLNYPSNPTGQTFSRRQLEEVAEVARDNDVVVLSDEIYGKLHHRGRHDSIVNLLPEQSIYSGGLSKWCGAGGWRLGVFVFPRRLRWLLDAMAAVGTETFTATSSPIQYAAVRAFQEGPEIESYLGHSRRILGAIGRVLTSRLTSVGANVLPPEGAFYLFPDFSPFARGLVEQGIETSAEMCARLLDETGVAMLPGSDFGRPPHEFTARIAYVDFDGERALRASASIPEDQDLGLVFVQKYCGRLLEAVERICLWVIRSPKHARARHG